MTLESHPYWIGRLMLVTINILPMVLMFILLAGIAERLGTSDWGRLFVVAAGTLGTFLTTFAVVLNNHIVGAVSATVALYAFVRIWFDGDNRLRYYALAGLASAFTAANELPALAFLALIGLALLTRDRRAWLLGFAPAAALVVVAFFATNYIAHESLRPPYMHRSETDPDDNWYRYTYTIDGVERTSYWQNRQGIDRGETSKAVYAMHVLVGHHGVFSLTPVWLLSFAGMAIWLVRGTAQHRWLTLGIAFFHRIATARRPQLRRHDQRFPLDVLVRPTLANHHAASRRPPCFFTPRSNLRTRPAGDVGPLSQLSHLEPLDPALDLQLVRSMRLAGSLIFNRLRTRPQTIPVIRLADISRLKPPQAVAYGSGSGKGNAGGYPANVATLGWLDSEAMF